MMRHDYAKMCIIMRPSQRAVIGMSGWLLTLTAPLTVGCQRCEAWPGLDSAASRPGRGGFVLLDDAGRDAPALADRDALAFRPRPDIAAALPA